MQNVNGIHHVLLPWLEASRTQLKLVSSRISHPGTEVRAWGA
jgi:hypothetical protein